MNKFIKISLFLVFSFFLTLNVNAQNKKINIQAEKVADGVKIVTTENGKKTEVILDFKEAEEYLKKMGDNIQIDIDETSDNNYKITYGATDGKTETIEVDLESILDNISLDFNDLKSDLKELIDEFSSQLEYEETTDENGNKVIKLKSAKEEE